MDKPSESHSPDVLRNTADEVPSFIGIVNVSFTIVQNCTVSTSDFFKQFHVPTIGLHPVTVY